MKELHRIHIPIYKDTLFIFFGSKQDCQQALIKNGMCEEEALCFKPSDTANGFFIYFEKDGLYLIWMPVVPETIANYGVLVHEILHFVYRFLAERGMKMDDSSEEAYTYLMEYIFNEIDNFIVTERKQTETK